MPPFSADLTPPAFASDRCHPAGRLAFCLHDRPGSKKITSMTPQQLHTAAGRAPSAMEREGAAPSLERARGEVRIAIRAENGVSRPRTLYQSGSAKVRLPRVAAGEAPEAVLLNTAGGLTGGDRLAWRVDVEPGAGAVVTSQAAERIYRRSSGAAEIGTTLTVGAGARLDWLPQETILFDRSALSRRLEADLDGTANLLAVEAFVLGRAAMGESVRSTFVSDAWRIRRGGRLVFADVVRLDGDVARIVTGPATGGGAAAVASLVLVAPDAETKLGVAREALGAGSGESGASAWNGLLVARLVAPSGQALRADLIKLVEALRGTAMPRVWHC
jgi:urease accessory protein